MQLLLLVLLLFIAAAAPVAAAAAAPVAAAAELQCLVSRETIDIKETLKRQIDDKGDR